MPRLLLAIALAVLLLAPSRLAAEAAYLLQRGDRVDVTVYGHADLSGPLTLDHAGAVALPIGGSVPAAGLSAQQLERRITDILGGGYIIRPQVTVRIAELRPVYVLGAVRNAGAVAYRPGMTALAAIALATVKLR
jgi:polysaccharide export outer membrane protein